MGAKYLRSITKILKSASGVLYGRATAGTGRGEELSPASVREMLSVSTDAENAVAYQETLVSGTNIKTINSTSLLGSGDIAISGSSSDLLSTLTASEIAITGTATATISRMHVCSGTSSNYTVTLPAASGNAGKLIGFRMASGLTKLVTIDGNSSETIDGATTQIMWSSESAILLCDGTSWTKIAGRSIPMTARLSRSTDQTGIAGSTWTKISLNQQDSGASHLWDSANSRASIVRPNVVSVSFGLYLTNCSSFAYMTATRNGISNSAPSQPFQQSSPVSGVVVGAGAVLYSVVPGDYIQLACYANSGGTLTALAAGCIAMQLTEIPQW